MGLSNDSITADRPYYCPPFILWQPNLRLYKDSLQILEKWSFIYQSYLSDLGSGKVISPFWLVFMKEYQVCFVEVELLVRSISKNFPYYILLNTITAVLPHNRLDPIAFRKVIEHINKFYYFAVFWRQEITYKPCR